MKLSIFPPDESFQIRCPRLGHPIHFAYCRQENLGAPCCKTLDCWFSFFPVEQFLRQELSPEEWESAFGKPPKPKILSLLEMIEQAQKRTGSNNSAKKK
jgi:hypothetical protein